MDNRKNSGHEPSHKSEPVTGSEPITGNASNPTSSGTAEPGGPQGLLDERADKYIREVASIEDLPDDQDQQDMDQVIKDDQESTREGGGNI